MTTARKFAVAFCVFALVAGGLWWYWECPISLENLIPEEKWVRMEMEQTLPHNMAGNLVFKDPPMEDVLSLLPAIRVTRAQNSNFVEDNSFRITLYKGEAWPTVMYVSPSDGIKIAAELDFVTGSATKAAKLCTSICIHAVKHLQLCFLQTKPNSSLLISNLTPHSPHSKKYIQPQHGSI